MKRFLSLFDPLRYVGRPEYFVIFLITACVEIGLCFLIANIIRNESLDNIGFCLMLLSYVLFVLFGCAVWGRLRSIDKSLMFPLIFCILLVLYNVLLELHAHYNNMVYLSLRHLYSYINSFIFILFFAVIGIINPVNREEKPNKYKLRLKRIIFNPLIILLNILFFYFISMCMTSMGYDILLNIILFAYIFISLFLIFCRLQDMNISGWWCFLFAFMPVIILYDTIYAIENEFVMFLLIPICIISPVLLMFGKSINAEEKPANSDDNEC